MAIIWLNQILEVKLEIRRNSHCWRNHQQVSHTQQWRNGYASMMNLLFFFVLFFTTFSSHYSSSQYVLCIQLLCFLCKYLFRKCSKTMRNFSQFVELTVIIPMTGLVCDFSVEIQCWPFRYTDYPLTAAKTNRNLNGIIIVTQIKCCYDIVTEKVPLSTSRFIFLVFYLHTFHARIHDTFPRILKFICLKFFSFK